MNTSPDSDNEGNKLLRYQVLMQRRQHIERIFWSRIQALYLIQAAVLGVSLYLHPLPLLGILLTFILYILCRNDWSDARINDVMFHNLGDSLGIRRTGVRWRIFGREILSHRLLFVVVKLFVIIDSVVFVLFYANPGWAETVRVLILVLIFVIWILMEFPKKENLLPHQRAE